MNYIKAFESYNERLDISILINDLLFTMMKKCIISFDGIKIESSSYNNIEDLIEIEGFYNLYVRKQTIVGYYPGNIHTFFLLTGGKYEMVKDKDYNKCYNKIKSLLDKLKNNSISNIKKGNLNIELYNYEEPIESNIMDFYNKKNISDETKSVVRGIMKDLDW